MRFNPLPFLQQRRTRRTFLKAAGLTLTASVLRPHRAHAADPISADRLIYGGTWEGLVGIEGGIPTTYTKSGDTISAYTGTAGTINTAISGASDNTYVELGTGTFSLSTAINLTNSRTILRGQVDGNGVPTTTLSFTGGSPAIFLGASGWDISNTGSFTTRNVSSPSGASLRGASTVTLASAPTGMTVNQPIFFSDDSQGGDDFYGFGSTGAGRSWMHWARCTAIDGSDISFSPAISADFLTGTLQCHYKAGGGMSRLCGLENVIVTSSSSRTLAKFNGADECWIKNCIIGPTSGNSQIHHVDNYCSFRCQIDHCELHSQVAYGNSSYVINAYAAGSMLIVNNYIHDIANIMPMFGMHSSAFAYNYCNAFSYDSPNNWLSQIVFGHGAFNDYCLFEGNWVAASYNDNVANSKNMVWLRNRMRGYDADGETGVTTGNTQCMTCCQGHLNQVMVGNVLGENGYHDTVLRTFSTDDNFPADCIYNLRTDTTATFVRKGNYNTVDDGINAAETLAGGEVIATSYLYGAKPAWFGNRPWPWCDPANYAQSNDPENVPAGFRALNGFDPPSGSPAFASPVSLRIMLQ